MKSCWRLNPAERKGFDELEADFHQILETARHAVLPAQTTSPYSILVPIDPDGDINNDHVVRASDYVEFNAPDRDINNGHVVRASDYVDFDAPVVDRSDNGDEGVELHGLMT